MCKPKYMNVKCHQLQHLPKITAASEREVKLNGVRIVCSTELGGLDKLSKY